MRMIGIALAVAAACASVAPVPSAWAWSSEGHQVIGLIADHYLEPSVRDQVHAMLAQDKSGLTRSDISSEAAWADRYRDYQDKDGKRPHYLATREWHWIDIEIDRPSQNAACFGHPKLPPGTLASKGPAHACLVDKLDQFTAELGDRNTPAAERLIALQFVLHLVGEVHAPLHAADNHDRGADKVAATFDGKSTTVHRVWNEALVARLGKNPQQVADDLIAKISPDQLRQWSRGAPENWAQQSFELARDHAYKLLPPPDAKGMRQLDEAYISDGTQVVASQLSKAGVRLAAVLNKALAP